MAWASTTDLLGRLHRANAMQAHFDDWITELIDELVASGAAAREQSAVRNAG
jgi:hypothetical protein